MLESLDGSVDHSAVKAEEEAANRSGRADQDDEECVLPFVNGAVCYWGRIWYMHGVFLLCRRTVRIAILRFKKRYITLLYKARRII